MKTKIKLFWCDDEYALKVQNPINEDYLEDHGIVVESFSKSDDLLSALDRPNIENHVDAVIFDYNMSNISDGRPEIDEKSGFLEILRNMKKYVEKGIPFFLWSKMDFDLIRGSISESSDYRKELSIFDNYINDSIHKRWFAGDDFEELIDSVLSDIENLNLPHTRLRWRYPEAYEAAMSVSQKCWDDIVAVLTLTPESDDWHRMEDLINPLRCHVEEVMKRLGVPAHNGKISLNSLGKFVAGKHPEFSVHRELVDPALGYGITNLITFIQDGSHQHETLNNNVRIYLIEKKDEHLLYYIAHSFINLLIWANKARLLKEDIGDICFPKEKKHIPKGNMLNNDNILKVDAQGCLYIGDCQITNYIVGRSYSITEKKQNTNRVNSYKYFSMRIEPLNE